MDISNVDGRNKNVQLETKRRKYETNSKCLYVFNFFFSFSFFAFFSGLFAYGVYGGRSPAVGVRPSSGGIEKAEREKEKRRTRQTAFFCRFDIFTRSEPERCAKVRQRSRTFFVFFFTFFFAFSGVARRTPDIEREKRIVPRGNGLREDERCTPWPPWKVRHGSDGI